MRLRQGQKQRLLEWVAEGLGTAEINDRASRFDPPFTVSDKLVHYYRRTRAVKLDALLAEQEHSALTTGLALKENRVRALQMLADFMAADILGDTLWTTDVKQVGTRIVEVERFNASEVEQYRKTLEQIASEVGDAETNINLRGEVKVTFVKAAGQK